MHHDPLNQERAVNLSTLATFDLSYSAEGVKKLTTTNPRSAESLVKTTTVTDRRRSLSFFQVADVFAAVRL